MTSTVYLISHSCHIFGKIAPHNSDGLVSDADLDICIQKVFTNTNQFDPEKIKTNEEFNINIHLLSFLIG